MASNKNYMLNDNFPKQIKNATSTKDGLMAAEDKAKLDGLFEFGLLSPVTPYKDGIMIKEDKSKLDGIETGANNYIHPIDENTKHVSDTQINKWNNQVFYSNDIPTTMTVGGISKGSTFYNVEYTEVLDTLLHPTESTIYDKLDSESTELSLSANQGKVLNTKIVNHTTDTVKHITEEERIAWNAKASVALATQTSNGLMSASDKKKLDSISTGANTYVHPDTHSATMIEQDTLHRFVTDEQISSWNNLINKVAELEEKLKAAIFLEKDTEGGI